MKFSLSWLKEHLDTTASLTEICQKLTAIGLEVESLVNQAEIYDQFAVAKIIEAKPHETASKLKICQVEVEQGKNLQIVCGAANARAGIKVAYAAIGSVIPANQMVIKKAKIAGTESFGMLCSRDELKLEGNSDGIIEIDDKWPVGTKISEVFGCNDAVIEINVTPNRGDCLGIIGVARDLAASGIGKLKIPAIKLSSSTFPLPISIENNAQEACKYVAFRYLKNIKNCQSPEWLKKRLAKSGINSISAVVDVTNYVMLLLNRPMHAYDASKIKDKLLIRFANSQEEFISLSEDKFQLDEKVLVIADQEKPLGIAGIIGSNNSACSIDTTEILLEAALFEPKLIAAAGRKLNILSDARYRFERGVDYKTCESGIELATQLILEICGGEASEVKVIGNKPQEKKIEFDVNLVKKLTNVEASIDKVLEVLTNLEFTVVKSNIGLTVTIPSHRYDVAIVEDLVEEVSRIIGYDKIIKERLPNIQETNWINYLGKVRQKLVANGMIESINWSFCDSNLVEFFAQKNEKLTLANPISQELDHMRPNLLIGLLEACRKNFLRNFSNLAFFEIGNVFVDAQKMMVSGVRTGKNKGQSHYHDERDVDVFDVKKDFSDVLEVFGLRLENLQISANEAPKYYHPHRFAALRLGKNLVGYFGEIHPLIAKKFEAKNRLNVFEIFVDNLPKPSEKSASRKAISINDLPIVERDFAFTVAKDQAVADMIKAINACDKQLIKQVEIFDIFSGKNIEEGKKSVALRVKIQPLEKTLTSEEIEVVSKKIVDAVGVACGAVLRS